MSDLIHGNYNFDTVKGVFTNVFTGQSLHPRPLYGAFTKEVTYQDDDNEFVFQIGWLHSRDRVNNVVALLSLSACPEFQNSYRIWRKVVFFLLDALPIYLRWMRDDLKEVIVCGAWINGVWQPDEGFVVNTNHIQPPERATERPEVIAKFPDITDSAPVWQYKPKPISSEPFSPDFEVIAKHHSGSPEYSKNLDTLLNAVPHFHTADMQMTLYLKEIRRAYNQSGHIYSIGLEIGVIGAGYAFAFSTNPMNIVNYYYDPRELNSGKSINEFYYYSSEFLYSNGSRGKDKVMRLQPSVRSDLLFALSDIRHFIGLDDPTTQGIFRKRLDIKETRIGEELLSLRECLGLNTLRGLSMTIPVLQGNIDWQSPPGQFLIDFQVFGASRALSRYSPIVLPEIKPKGLFRFLR